MKIKILLIKSPTFKGKTAEVGPLAKYIVVYTKVNKALSKIQLGLNL